MTLSLIGLAGPAGVGKDTVADYLIEVYNFSKFSFSDALYREVSKAFGVSVEFLQDRGLKEEDSHHLRLMACSDPEFVRIAKDELAKENITRGVNPYLAPQYVSLSPRWILQRWGTDYRRAQNPSYWINAAKKWMVAWLDSIKDDGEYHGGLVNTSVRFENERDFIKREKGLVWHLRRPGALDALNGSTATYVSERELPVLPDEVVIHNNATIQKLRTAVSLVFGDPSAKEIATSDDYMVECVKCGKNYMPCTRAEAIEEAEAFNRHMLVTDQAIGRQTDPLKFVTVEDYIGCEICKGTEFKRSDARLDSEADVVLYESK